ncbi:MAG: diguanylate cyclase [bacterium]|nr:diguanylate cyclase [bacterium]MCP5068347.1 diguanylate cyclase [bacterium]
MEHSLVLVADPSALMRQLVTRCIEQLGMRAVAVATGREAMAAAEEKLPDAILISWELPEVPGPDLLRHWQTDPELRWVPVIMLTSHTEPGRIEEAMGLGAHDFLNKPFEAAEFNARLRAALRVRDLQQQLRELADRDALTHLANRRVFEDRLDRELLRSTRYGGATSLAVLDIDYFKRVNDEHGHDAGDAVLVQFAELMTKELREVDLVARYGGEEFVVILPDTDLADATIVLDRLRTGVSQHTFVTPNGALHVTVSVGVAATIGTCTDRATLFKTADTALYQAKESGRNRVVMASDGEKVVMAGQEDVPERCSNPGRTSGS